MSEPQTERLVMALTKSGIDRGDLLQSCSDLSDESLITALGGTRVSPSQIPVLAHLSKVLRLMDSYLTDEKTSRQFAQEFSELWLSLGDWGGDPALEKDLVQGSHFYRRVQLFSDVPEHRREEPLLFGEERLVELTGAAYMHLKQSWLRALVGESAWAAS